jgi:hypothetical protein
VSGDEHSGFMLQQADAGTYHLNLSDGRELTTQVSGAISQNLPAGHWTIAFQPDRGAPSGSHPLHSFHSWTDSPIAGVRYFSGTATYRTEVDVKPASTDRVYLTLTDLHEICTVRINGQLAGTLWAMPYRLDITASLAQDRNTIEIEVTNLWPNRIIGDAQPSTTHTYTRTNIRKYKADSPLLPSGLIGPVALEIDHKTTITLPRNSIEESVRRDR